MVQLGLGTSNNTSGLCSLGGGAYLAQASETGDMARSTDDGLTWTPVTAIIPDAAGLRGRMMGAGANTGLCGTHGALGLGGFWRTTDGGTTWGRVYTPTNVDIGNFAYDFTQVSGATWIASGSWRNDPPFFTKVQALRSTTSGASWTPLGEFSSTFGDHGKCVATFDNGTILIVGTSGTPFATNPVMMARSTNGGSTFTGIAMPGPMLAGLTPRVVACCALSADVGLAGGSGLDLAGNQDFWLWRTTDRGATWTRITDVENIDSTTNFYEVRSFLSLDGITVVVSHSTDNGVDDPIWRVSNDAGQTWQNLSVYSDPIQFTGLGCYQMIFTDAGNILGIAGDYRIWRGVVTYSQDEEPAPEANNAVTPSTARCCRGAFATASCRQAC